MSERPSEVAEVQPRDEARKAIARYANFAKPDYPRRLVVSLAEMVLALADERDELREGLRQIVECPHPAAGEPFCAACLSIASEALAAVDLAASSAALGESEGLAEASGVGNESDSAAAIHPETPESS